MNKRNWRNALLYVFLTALWGIGALSTLWTVQAEDRLTIKITEQAPQQHAVSFSTPIPFPPATFTPLPTPSQNPPTSVPTSTPFCRPPAGWHTITLGATDTLKNLAARYHTTVEILRKANCLPAATLVTGAKFFVPSIPPTTTPSASPTPTIHPPLCGPPAGWVIHIVAPGENLYRLSLAYRVSVPMLQGANCLRSTLIYVGQRLWVPPVATSTPLRTNTPVPTASPAPSPTIVATNTSPPTATNTPSPTSTPTPLPTTVTPTPTNTSTAPTNTPSPTLSASPTPSPTPSPTDTPTPSPTSTATSTPSL